MLFDRPGSIDFSKRRQAQREARWEKYLETESAEVMAFAQNWAEAMERRLEQTRNSQVRYIAMATLTEVGGDRLSVNRIWRIVGILKDTWYLGGSLEQWAKKEL